MCNRPPRPGVPAGCGAILAIAHLLAVSACAPGPAPPRAGDPPDPAAARAVLLQAEDRRDPAGARALLASTDPAIRARACLALGRIRDSRDGELLARRLGDDDASVRASAAFALGLLADERSAGALAAALGDAAPRVRAQAARALTRLPPTAGSAAALLPLLRGDDRGAAGAALYGLWRLQDPAVLDDVLRLAAHPDGDLRAAASYCLMRMVSAAAVGATPVPGGTELDSAARGRAAAILRRLAADEDGRIRELAARGLGGPGLPGAVDALLALLDDPVWRVRVNALRSLGSAGGFEAGRLAASLDDRNPNVRLAALAALGSLPAGGALEARVRRELQAPEATLRAAAAATLAAWQGASFLPDLLVLAADEDPSMRAAAAGLLGAIAGPEAEASLRSLRADGEPRVQAAALTALAGRDGSDPGALAAGALGADDFTVRAMAVGLLPAEQPGRVEALASAWAAARADPQNDVRMAVAHALGAMPDDDAAATGLLERVLRDDPDWRVRVEAAAVLRARGRRADARPLETGRDLSYYERVVRDAERRRRAVVDTARGRIVLELFGREAPLTVRNFEELARSGYFDGQVLHRVVPNFVVQGGDPRGDGWGGPGHQIRCEINRRLYERGTLGMALDGYDTGGSQFFVTHTPQPHLDGGYTVFGRVIEGIEVVDHVVQGDRILAVRIEEAAP